MTIRNLLMTTGGGEPPLWTTAKELTSIPPNAWAVISCSSDGTKVIAGAGTASNNGFIWTSNDSGASWKAHWGVNGGVSTNWQAVACSDDGRVLVGGKSSGYLWISTDYGNNWYQRHISKSWKGAACSNDGTIIYVCATNGSHIYKSTDSGVTWSEMTTSLGTRYWQDIACSPDGSIVGAVTSSPAGKKGFYKSINGGSTWTVSSFVGDSNYTAVGLSADGSKAVVSVNPSYVYVSSNGGVNWSAQTSLGTAAWSAVTCSDDGTKLVAVTATGGVEAAWTSDDGGTSWTKQTKLPTRSWTGAASSSNGKVVYLSVGGGGKIYKLS